LRLKADPCKTGGHAEGKESSEAKANDELLAAAEAAVRALNVSVVIKKRNLLERAILETAGSLRQAIAKDKE